MDKKNYKIEEEKTNYKKNLIKKIVDFIGLIEVYGEHIEGIYVVYYL